MDPVKDDVMMFIDRLLMAGNDDVRVKEVELLPHGWLNYWMPFPLGLWEAKKSVQIATDMLGDLIFD